jgi:hypothetical protein
MMLALARALAQHRDTLKRSFLFVSLTGEEAGLVGAQVRNTPPPHRHRQCLFLTAMALLRQPAGCEEARKVRMRMTEMRMRMKMKMIRV